MPSIPTYDQRTTVSGAGLGPGPSTAGSVIEKIGGDLQGVADDQYRLQSIEQQVKERQALVSANSTLMSARSDWLTQFEQRKQQAPAGAPNFTPSILQDFDKDAQQRIASAATPNAKTWLTQHLAQVRLGLQQDALTFEAGALTKQKFDTLAQSADQARTAAQFRPQDFDAINGAQRTAILGSGLPAEQEQELLQKHTAAIADAAITGLVQKDPYTAMRELHNEQSANPAMRALDFHDRERLISEAQTEINRRKAEARENLVMARDALNERVQDAQAAYMSGVPVTNPPTRDDFRAAYPPDHRIEADRRYASFTNVAQIGADLQAATRMTPDEQNELLEKRRPSQEEGAALQLQAYNVLAGRIASLQKSLAKDPAAYVANYNPGVTSAATAFAQSPSPQTAQAYVQASVGAQQAMGVIQPRLLTEPQAHAISDRLKLDGNGSDVVQSIAQEKQLWGRYWPQVLGEAAPKLNPAVQVIALGMDPVPAARLATVAGMKPADLAKILPPDVKSTDIRTAVQGQMQDFSATLIGHAGAENQLGRLTDAATQLASSYVAGGASLKEATQRAANEVVLSRYDVMQWRGNSLRIPKGVDTDLVRSGLTAVSGQTLRDLGVSSGAVQWRTLPDDSGVVLEDAATNRPLARKDGTLVSFGFDALAQAAVNRNEKVRQLEQQLK